MDTFQKLSGKKGEFAPEEKKEEPMEIPEGEKYTIVTGGAQGADAYAERLALAYECKLDIKIGPNHPRAQCIVPLYPFMLMFLMLNEPLYKRAKPWKGTLQ